MSDELKPCPRCGSEAVETCGDNGWKYARAFCDSCGISTKYHASIQDAIADWNTRTDGWVTTSERVPKDGHPLWMTDDNDEDVLPGLYLDEKFWLPEETPFRINGKWIVTRIERPLDEPPKRWRYML